MTSRAGLPSIPGYEIDRQIGKGGMGTVFKAHQVMLDRPVAVKILDDRWARKKSFVQQFLREARAAAKIDHPNVVRAIDAGSTGGTFYFVMEYVPGNTVGDILKARGCLSQSGALHVVDQMTDALIHAEELGIVHRDIKPGNILVTPDGVAKLSDLGLARETTDLSETTDGTVIGTPDYMSPEQVKGQDDLDVRSDIYSLGATLHHMLTGKAPFPSKTAAEVIQKHLFAARPNPSAVNPAVSRHAAALVRKMMAIDRNMRPRDAKTLKAMIAKTRESIAADGPLPEAPAAPGGAPAGTETPLWKQPPVIIGGAAAATLVLVCFVAIRAFRGCAEPEAPPKAAPVIVKTETEEERARREAARREAEAERAYESVVAYHKEHPADCTGVLAKLEGVAADHAGTAAGSRAAADAAELRKTIDTRVAEMTDNAGKALSEGDFRSAEQIYVDLLSEVPTDPWKADLETALADVRARARAAFDKVVEEVASLVEAGKYEESMLALQNALGNSVASIAEEEAGRVAAVAGEWERARNEAARLAALLAEARGGALEYLGNEGISAMLAAYGKVVADTRFRDVRASLQRDSDELSRARTILRKAAENGPSFVGKPFTVRGIAGIVARVADGRVTISTQGIETSEPLENLEADNILDLAGISINERNVSFDAAVLYLCREKHERAREILERLSDAGTDVENVLVLLDIAEQKARERTARKLVRSVQHLASAKNWMNASVALETLRREYGETQACADAESDLDLLATVIDENLKPKTPAAPASSVRKPAAEPVEIPVQLPGMAVKTSYDRKKRLYRGAYTFTNAEELNDWVSARDYNPDAWRVEDGKLIGLGRGMLVNKIGFVGDMAVEVTAHSNARFSLTIGEFSFWWSPTPHIKKESAVLTESRKVYLIKEGLTRPHVNRYLTNAPQGKIVLRCARRGRTLSWHVNGELIGNISDSGDLKRDCTLRIMSGIHHKIFGFDGWVRIDSIAFEGRVSSRWIQKARQAAAAAVAPAPKPE